MKKLISIVIVIAALLAMTAPAMASVSTSVTVLSGGAGVGDPPDIVASWVMCDDSPAPGTQVYPPLQWGGQKTLYYFALVDDRQGDSDVVNVDVDVWHPQGSPPPYDANDYLKYERSLIRYQNFAGANNPWAGAFEEYFADTYFGQAVAAGVLTADDIGTNPSTGVDYTIGEIWELIDQESVGFWATCGEIIYEQPAGYYPVEITAVDKMSNISTLDYCFYYIPVSMVEFDFNAINFGKVQVDTPQEIDGDRGPGAFDKASDGPGTVGYQANGQLYPDQATVRNIGNVWSNITVEWSNLSQGGQELPKTPNWNVTYDACFGDPGLTNPKTYFYPLQQKTLCGDLYLSTWEKLDFSIRFLKYGQTGTWTGTVDLGSVIAPDWPTELID